MAYNVTQADLNILRQGIQEIHIKNPKMSDKEIANIIKKQQENMLLFGKIEIQTKMQKKQIEKPTKLEKLKNF